MTRPEPKLIVGLGNPGVEYARTRHNVGFAVIDALLAGSRRQAVCEHYADSQVYTLSVGGRQLTLMKPETFMNASGVAVVKVQRRLELLPGEVLAVCDCLDLPFGRLRLRPDGSSGGHRGIESLTAEMQSSDFPRLRIGIGRPGTGQGVVEHVLAEWTPAETEAMETVVAKAAEAVLVAVRRGIEFSMNYYNKWSLPQELPEAGSGKENNSKESQD